MTWLQISRICQNLFRHGAKKLSQATSDVVARGGTEESAWANKPPSFQELREQSGTEVLKSQQARRKEEGVGNVVIYRYAYKRRKTLAGKLTKRKKLHKICITYNTYLRKGFMTTIFIRVNDEDSKLIHEYVSANKLNLSHEIFEVEHRREIYKK